MALATFAVEVVDQFDVPVQDAGVILNVGQEGRTNADGYVAFVVPTGLIQFSVHKAHYIEGPAPIVSVQGNTQVRYNMVRIIPLIPPRIHTEGMAFKLPDGATHLLIGSTELLLGYVYDTQGPDAIRPVLHERHDVGFNNLRVLWQKDVRNAGVLWQMPLEKLSPFMALCAEYGFWVEGTILADCQVVNPSEAAQLERVRQVRAATAGISNHIEQLGNEFGKNGFDWTHFSRPTDRLCVNASGTNGFDPAQVWDFFAFSAERAPEQKAIREYGPLEVMYAVNTPAIVDECAKPGMPYTDPSIWFRMGAQARSGAGGRFHSEAGTGNQNPNHPVNRLFNPLELRCAIQFVKGLVG